MLASLAAANAGTIWHEGDDGEGGAGGLPASANITLGVGPLTDIIGGLGNDLSGADMYEIFISDPVNFSAITTGHGTDPIVNPAIYLFDASGDGLFGNDNISGVNSQAAIPAGTTALLSAGLYYILITPSGNLPANKNGDDSSGIYQYHHGHGRFQQSPENQESLRHEWDHAQPDQFGHRLRHRARLARTSRRRRNQRRLLYCCRPDCTGLAPARSCQPLTLSVVRRVDQKPVEAETEAEVEAGRSECRENWSRSLPWCYRSLPEAS